MLPHGLTRNDFGPLQKHEICSLAGSSPWRASQTWLASPGGSCCGYKEFTWHIQTTHNYDILPAESIGRMVR